MKKNKQEQGFTLVELLVVIAVVGLLTTVAIISFGGARMRSRDAQRVAYVKQINDALELYYLHNGIYPTLITPGQVLSVGTTNYLNPVPSNPTPRIDGTCPNSNFSYTVKPGNKEYNLKFCLGSATSSFAAGINACSQGGSCNAAQPDTVSGLLVWFRADWLDLSHGDQVSSWADLSGNSNTATQTVSAKKPIFLANVVNQKPVVRFDGIDDVVNLTTNVSTVRTVIIVQKWDSQIKSAAYPILLGHSSTYDFHGSTEVGGATDRIFIGSYTNDFIEAGSVWNNGTLVGWTNLYKDRNNFQLIELQPTGVVQFNNISSDRGAGYFHGDIAEVIIYDNVISLANRQKIQRYLRDKYALTVSGI